MSGRAVSGGKRVPKGGFAGLPLRGGDVAVYVFDINQPSLPHSFFFYSVLVSISVFMALSAVFNSVNYPNNSLLSHSVLPVLFLSYRSFQLERERERERETERQRERERRETETETDREKG